MNQQPEEGEKILPVLLMQSIYLVEEGEQAIKYLGNNKKNVLILIDNDPFDFLSEKEEMLLIKGKEKKSILEALSLSLEDIAMVNLAKSPVKSFKDIQMQFHPERVLAFGIHLRKAGLQMDAPDYVPLSLPDCKIVFSESLDVISGNDAKKKVLWLALQKMFGL